MFLAVNAAQAVQLSRLAADAQQVLEVVTHLMPCRVGLHTSPSALYRWVIKIRCNHHGEEFMKKTNHPNTLPTVLLTGFNAFGGDAINPSWLVAQALDKQTIEGHMVLAAQLPTEFSASRQQLAILQRRHKPALVVCLGLAGGRAGLSLERIAINVQDARIADNAGAQPIDVPIINSGAAAYFSTLPIKAMLQALSAAGIPAQVSQTAGTFVCNHVFYLLMHGLKRQRSVTRARGGFVHVPYLPDMGVPCMPLDEMVHGLRVAIMSALKTQEDALLGAGALN